VVPLAVLLPERALLRAQLVPQPLVLPLSRLSWPWLWWVWVSLPWKVVAIR
jgi:hypothetical protein